ncbi:MAG: hypothetical protein ACFBRM_15120 [Pikeienuella sp.]
MHRAFLPSAGGLSAKAKLTAVDKAKQSRAGSGLAVAGAGQRADCLTELSTARLIAGAIGISTFLWFGILMVL